jgi:anti-sigma regulatory factor (Ser/Thr protein kinase)
MEHPFENADEVFYRQMPSRLENRQEIIDEVLGKLASLGCNLDPFFDRLFLDEVISNAVLHGNGADPRKMVTVRAFCQKDRWGFEVADEGPGFDWRAFLEKLEKPMDLARPSGRGLQLILASGAELHFLDGGRRVVVVRERG